VARTGKGLGDQNSENCERGRSAEIIHKQTHVGQPLVHTASKKCQPIAARFGWPAERSVLYTSFRPRTLSMRNHLHLPTIDPLGNPEPENSSAPPAIAPAWHTIVLVVAIIAFSIHGAGRLSAIHGSIDRLASYGFSATMEVVVLAWVVLGLRLKKIPLRTLLGSFSFDSRSIATDLGFALVFWICSLMVRARSALPGPVWRPCSLIGKRPLTPPDKLGKPDRQEKQKKRLRPMPNSSRDCVP
jgi:hypothetical protein